MKRAFGLLSIVVAIAVASGYAVATDPDVVEPGSGTSVSPTPSSTPTRAAGCGINRSHLRRIQHGHVLGRSEDIVVIPRAFNYLGSFETTSHSGPKNYLQRVPLVFYGHGVAAQGAISETASLADIYSTAGRLLGAELEPRRGRLLESAIASEPFDPPRLFVLVVWDGVGRNVLERWPRAWPTLARLSRLGTSYVDAVAGSSPSITPATHSTMSTGVFPDEHTVTGIQYRKDRDTVASAFAHRDPAILKRSTFADQFDAAQGNAPKVGLVGWRSWHIGLLGHGSAYKGGDRDDLAVIGHHERITGRRPEFRVPSYVRGFPGLDEHLAAADASDGERDGTWRGHPVEADEDNPGWVAYQREIVKAVVNKGGYGRDATPDILLTNFKATDRVGHIYSLDAPEMGAVLRAQDRALGDIIELLDRRVGDYSLVVTADHGSTPPPEVSKSWPIHQRELEDDLDRHLGLGDGVTVTQAMTAVGLFVDRTVMKRNGIDDDDIAAFLAGYTIRENWSGSNLPEGYGGRGSERVFQHAFPAGELSSLAARCATSSDV